MESPSPTKVELPTSFEEVSIDDLVELIADMLQRLMSHNDKIPLLPENLSRFHSGSVPHISVLDYLKRIVQYTNVEKACLLLTLNYIDLISTRMPTFIFTSLVCHRFLIAAITASSKGLCDAFCTNQLYAKVGGITVTELNCLEQEFLSAVDWHLVCARDMLNEYYINLVRTNGSGRFALAGDTPQGGSDNDVDLDSVMSRDSSPDIPIRHVSSETPAPTIQASPEGVPRATLEQNMAFAALRQSQHQLHSSPYQQLN
ncbi:hypothetical protein AGABI1DRAFT_112545 [Agaricus bisporus var. burnettii JB137-S8]|uniref:Cyclin-domain-containing protein n=1 Tax=Agaricus bisporus var. burnettii (strain JB137-S8 / ATCC MYA-4627 / FGSC 10392) TaxID=597362 RepID=K5XBY7_AGABU|nr:uncharacterized protein AGABI1DRAFT_112545 [Agaricus bisporus var. burnettii JB137-S8]EKM80818.1 hypothetical protein AGABI1DRAFT_112545 [Agaricus bisporus var. burnettii JB137-S8]